MPGLKFQISEEEEEARFDSTFINQPLIDADILESFQKSHHSSMRNTAKKRKRKINTVAM